MSRVEKKYNVHNFLKFKIIEDEWLIDPLFIRPERGFGYFKNGQLESKDFDLVVEIGDFSPRNEDCLILDDKYYLKEDYFYCKDHDKILSWEIEWRGFEKGKPILVKISKNLTGSMAIGTRIIDCLIRYKMNEKGFPMIHSLAMAKNNGCAILSGRSGVGKTNSLLSFLEKGYKVLGDNWIIVNEGKAYSFPLPMNIFVFNLLPIVKQNLGLFPKFILYLKYALFKASFGYLKKKTPIEIPKLIPGSVIDEVPLKSLSVMIQSDKFLITEIPKEDALERLIVNDKMDRMQFYNYMQAYSYVFPDSFMAEHWNRLSTNLNKALPDDIPYYKIEVPAKYNQETFNNLLKHVEISTNNH